MKKLKFYWNADEEQLRVLARLALATGHKSIRELFGTLVSSGLESITKALAEARAEQELQEASHAAPNISTNSPDVTGAPVGSMPTAAEPGSKE